MLTAGAPTAREAAELYEVWALLEGAAAREFARRASDAQVLALRQAFEAIETSQHADDAPAAMLEAQSRFYDLILEGADNATIRSILGSLQARIAVFGATTLTAPGRPTRAVWEICAIVDAIERRDTEAAAAAASFHVRRAGRVLFGSNSAAEASLDSKHARSLAHR